METNLGAGCHNPEWTYKTCEGTYVTKLKPSVTANNGDLILTTTDPLHDPARYQQQMEHTLTELIKTEREISFYRQPQQGPNGEGASPPNSAEAKEWQRLHLHLKTLNGVPLITPFEFFAVAHNNGQPVLCPIKNQKGYLQDKGSCTIFSIKQLVTSIIGHELSSLHSHFLQTHDGKQHQHALDAEINAIEQRLTQLKTPAQNALNSYVRYLVELRQCTNIKPEHYLQHDTLVQSLAVYPDLYHRSLEATAASINQYMAQYRQIRDTRNGSKLFLRFEAFYLTLPIEFQQHFAANYNQMKSQHELRALVSKIVGFEPAFEFTRSILLDELKDKKSLSKVVINDLKILGKFYHDKQEFSVQNNITDPGYNRSLREFYQQAVGVRLSGSSRQQQIQQITDIAHTQFQPRHSTRRLIADVALLISTLFAGAGIVVGVARVLSGKTFFFSQEITSREAEIKALINEGNERNHGVIPKI